MKPLFFVFIGLFAKVSFGATWSVEIKDVETSEVRSYKFSEIDSHKLTMSKLKYSGCLLKIFAPIAKEMQIGKVMLQVAEAQCMTPGNGFVIKKVCNNIPNEADKADSQIFQIIEDANNGNKAKKKNYFRSYQISIDCG